MKHFTANSLRRLREQHGLSQSALADKIGVSAPTVNRWEKDLDKGGQEIPGPAQLLLGLLLMGEDPFPAGDPELESVERKNFWSLRLTLEDWQRLQGLANAAGYPLVRDYLMALVQEHLREEASR